MPLSDIYVYYLLTCFSMLEAVVKTVSKLCWAMKSWILVYTKIIEALLNYSRSFKYQVRLIQLYSHAG